MKIDVEGAELLVLDGSKKLAALQKTMFFVEMHSHEERSMSESGLAVLKWCQTQNYKPYYLKTHQLLTEAGTIADRSKCHLLLLPSQMGYPEGLSGISQRSELPCN